ncbi:hypothetical protein D3C79_703310 [compost metagenome]
MLFIDNRVDVAAPLHHILGFGELQVIFVFAIDGLLAQLRFDIMKISKTVAIAYHNQTQFQRHRWDSDRKWARFIGRNPVELALGDHLF